jgi:hypothetical protein
MRANLTGGSNHTISKNIKLIGEAGIGFPARFGRAPARVSGGLMETQFGCGANTALKSVVMAAHPFAAVRTQFS